MGERWQRGISGEDIRLGTRFLARLPGFLRHPVTLEAAQATLLRRLAHRDATFLALVRESVYDHAPSPYRQLLKLAGCEYGDLERLVTKDGVEEALRTLHRHGVYLTVDEFKGRRPVVRGNTTIAVDPRRLRNPRSAPRASSERRHPRMGDPGDYDLA